MATSYRDTYITGLQNAHALENQLIEVMERQAERLEHYPAMVTRLREHIDESRRQAARLEEILRSLGTSQSTMKDVGLSIIGNVAAMGHAMTQDEVLKNTFADFGAEYYEIATYRSLLTMAELAGDTAGQQLLQQSLQEEMNMARWIEDHLDEVVRTYMERESQGQKAGV